MITYIEIVLLEYIFSLILTREFLLCAHGWVGQTQLYYWRRISQSEIRNSAAAEKNWNRKARADKNSFPPTPFLFALLPFGLRPIFLRGFYFSFFLTTDNQIKT